MNSRNTITTARARRNVYSFTDNQGRACTSITLARNAGTARILSADIAVLKRADVSLNWFLNEAGTPRSYVRGHQRGGNTVTIARIITGARPDQHIHHLDGDRLNLRRDNLQVIKGRACARGCSDVAVVAPAALCCVHAPALAPVAAQEVRA